MGRIIDATLSVLDNYHLTRQDIYEFIALMQGLGIDKLQLSAKTLAVIKGRLPQGMDYYVESNGDRLNITGSLSGNIFCFAPWGQAVGSKGIPTVEFDEAIANIDGSLIHFTGFDTLILDGCDATLEKLAARIDFSQLIVTPGDTVKCANAIAYQFLAREVVAVVTTLTGIANHASTEQVVMAQKVIAQRDGFNAGLFTRLTSWIERVTKNKIPPNLPVLGEKIFHVESGVHVDGILKNASNYEPYSPSVVGLKREIVLGKLSGRASIDYKLKMLLNQIRPLSDIDLILQKVKQLAVINRSKLSDDDFVSIVREFDRHESY